MQDNKNKVLFRLCDDALIVANTGAPFTRRGVISVCYAHLSEKGPTPPEDTYECSDENLVEEIRKKAIAVYRMDKNRLQVDAAEESTIHKGYSGCVLWTLLQNADDAAKGAEEKADLIGEKGLGFKSVLEITREPEIYSGPFRFRFSSEETEKVLRQEGLESHQLIFRVPHLSEPSEECMELLEEYDTVIRLPFYGNEAKEEIVKRLGEINARCLLLCQQLDVIEVAIDGKVNILEIDRKAAGFATGTSDLTITTQDNTGSLNKEKWRRWLWVQKKSRNEKRLSVAVCLPFSGDKIVACETALPLHVFFPTNERIGAKALIHVSFDLQMNRGHLAKKQRNEDALMEAIERIVEQILVGIPPASAFDVFGDIVIETETEDGNDESDLIQKIKKNIVKAMKEAKFVPVVGGHKVRPEEAEIWRHNLGNVVRDDSDDIKEYNFLIPEFNEDDRKRDILKKLNPDWYVSDFQRAYLLKYCRNDSLEDCWRAFKSADSMVESEISQLCWPDLDEMVNDLIWAPIWFTEKGHARALYGESNALVLEKPDDWPAWLPADVLASEFGKRLIKLLDGREECSANYGGSGYQIGKWPLHEKKQFLIKVLCPFLETQACSSWNPEQHFRVLSLVMRWSGEIDFNDIKDDERNHLSRLIYVPTDKAWVSTALSGVGGVGYRQVPVNNKWLTAVCCYAGEDWGGPSLLEQAANPGQNHKLIMPHERWGLLLPFEKWPEEIKAQYPKESWKNLLQFLGVSWLRPVPVLSGYSPDGEE